MWKKSVCGLTILAAGLLVWSCGDGSVDSLTDNELMMISRFPSTIDYDMLDSVVNACKNDPVCWEKAKKTGEIYQGDYTKVLRDSSGNIVVVEGDSAFIWKDGKKLPVFDFSSNSAGDEDDEESSSSAAMSGSSSKYSSAAGYDIDEYSDGGDGPGSNGSGSGGSSITHERSSSSVQKVSSSSVDLSFLSSSSSINVLSSTTVIRSSSSKKVTSSSSVDLSFLSSSSSSLGVASSSSIKNERSSSSKIVIDQSSVSQSSSSVSEYVLSSSSNGTHGGGGGQETGCTANTLSGVCTVSPSPGYKNETVTYTFTPDANNKCFAYNEVEWSVTDPGEGANKTHWVDPSSSSRASFSFDVKYSSIGDKKSVIFTMGGQNKQCDAVTINRRCESNIYTCTRRLVSATNNLWKNDVKYEWTFSYSGCLEGVSYTWQGALSGSTGSTVTKTFTGTSPINQSVSLSIVDELHGLNGEGASITKTCDPAVAVYDPDLPPTFNVSNMTMPVNYTVKVIPTSVTGCSYTEGNKCSYSLEDGAGTVAASSTGGYTSGALNSFNGPTDEGTVNYTLTLTNYIGSSEPKEFSITYVTPTPRDVSTSSTSYAPASAYSLSTASSISEKYFKCVTNYAPSSGLVIGYLNGTEFKAYPGQWDQNKGYEFSASSTYTFVIFNDAPSNIQCYLSW